MMYAYSNNGLSCRAVQAYAPAVMTALIPAVWSDAVDEVQDEDGNIIIEASPSIEISPEIPPQIEIPEILAYETVNGEVLIDHYPATLDELTAAFTGYAIALQKDNDRKEIAVLQATITPDKLMAAFLGTDNGWLAATNSQIVALTAQLNS